MFGTAQRSNPGNQATEDAPAPIRVNFRQAGVKQGGRLVKGAPKRRQSTAASVPTRTVAVLRQEEDRENTGFGGSSGRFVRAATDGQPGPGSYLSEEVRRIEKTSSNRKGYGNGFVSATDRFGRSRFRALPAPGPGSYVDPKDQFISRAARKYMNSKGTSSFLQERPASSTVDTISTPGPGSYVAQHRPEPRKRNKSIPFGATGARSEMANRSHGPGAGAYDVPSSLAVQKRTVSAAFHDRSQRSQFTIGLGPGPGDYDVKSSIGHRNQSAGTAGMFKIQHVPSSADEHSRVKREDNTPGPGAYDVGGRSGPVRPEKGYVVRPGPATRRIDSTTAAFRAQDVRFKSELSSAPGPGAYGSDRHIGHKSYNLNARKQWIS